MSRDIVEGVSVFAAPLPDDLKITVCAECFQASCWHGVFHCEKYRTADIVEMAVGRLRKLALESEDYWNRDSNAVEWRAHNLTNRVVANTHRTAKESL